MKTGECFYRDDLGNLCLAESFEDENGVVTTQSMIIEAAPETPVEAE